ncbi:MAG: GspH/FimT family pseudopilin [Deltaproteobacteria bacterium]|nr:GspH/FimT family pseudopilin [Deltaproteobacteria bacterium]
MKLHKHIQSPSGFTVIELMVTIGVAAILMGIAIPSFLSWLPTIRLSSAARQIATDLQLARMRAISQNISLTVTFDAANGTYSFGTDSRNLDDLYPGITITTAPTNPTFTPRGTANAITVTISNGSASKTVQVSAVGRVKIL